ncbi:MAG TPA: DUF192 domain-containing protein [candidate division Zixibacteria bacterium]|nr:DUF192 domain-containing protein [candidate division Zixibacteria bacterium]
MKKLTILVAIFVLGLLGCKEEAVAETPSPADEITQEAETAKEYTPRLPTRKIFVDTFAITVEMAEKPPDRQRGLMYRDYLPDTIGMLFIFDAEAPHSFWMKNTRIPLSIAFIDKDFVITDIKWMKPGDLTSHGPSRPILYALETNRGWFTQRGIKPGAKVRLSE